MEPDSSTLVQENLNSGEIRTYKKVRFLGKGAFARVYEFVCLDTNKVTAAKVIQKSSLTKPRTRLKLMNEIKIHKSLQHENVVQFEHVFEDSSTIYILLELCTNHTLSDLIKRRKRITELEVRTVLHQLVSGLKYIHTNKIIHRDLKLGNLFLDENMQLKIGDFGLATKIEYEGELKRTICGTPNYIAPEILDGRHSFMADVWSLGVLAFTLVVGTAPFESESVNNTYQKIRASSYVFPEHIELSGELQDLISKMLVLNPEERLSLDEILSHVFFADAFPPLLPHSALAVPPSSSYMKKFLNETQTKKPKFFEIFTDMHKLETIKISPLVSPKGNKKVPTLSEFRDLPFYALKWIDYTSKYGLVYHMSNEHIAINFNDGTKIVSNGDRFLYCYKVGPQRRDEWVEHTVQDYPGQYSKKVELLAHFKNRLMIPSQDRGGNTPWVEKWTNTPHAIVFKFSNQVIQVYFSDKTELLIDERQVAFINRGRELKFSNLDAEHTPDLQKRLKFTRSALYSTVTSPKNNSR